MVARRDTATRSRKPAGRKKLAVFKLASCDGCQLTLLDCEDELLALTEYLQIANFLEASSEVLPGPYDLALIEGSITTAGDAERVRKLRAQSRVLVAIGACATAGGIQALRNFADVREYARLVYPHPEYLETLATSTPVSAHVAVDFELRGCPISKEQLLELIAAFLQGRRPQLQQGSVCLECKRLGTACLLVARGTPCLGPVTQAGCGALCPTYARGCFGCFGPQPTCHAASLAGTFRELGLDSARLGRLFRTYNAAAPDFEQASKSLGQTHD
jgi:sulfhydrogenase subunit delta